MGEGFKFDPAVEKWTKMRETTHLYFRPTAKSAAVALAVLVGVPIGLYKLIEIGDVIFGLFLLHITLSNRRRPRNCLIKCEN